MSTDAGQQDRARLRGSLWLPKVIRVDIAHVRYPKPKQYVIERGLRDVTEAVEIVIHTDEEMPGGAAAPVLYVGEQRLTESEPAGLRQIKFLGFDIGKLKEGAPIELGWDVSQAPRSGTGFYYRLDK
jgi:hypothetical protein